MTSNIKFTALQKNLILSTARTIFKDFVGKKQKLNERREKIIADNKVVLDKKLAVVDTELEVIDGMQKKFESNIIELLGGYRLEDVVNFEPVTSESGRTTMKCTFKYPDTILPPTDETEEGVHADCAESAPQAENEFQSIENPVEERKADIDEDMAGEFVPTPEENEPEYDGAGFSTEDGLQEGEPAELAEQVNEPDPDEIEDMWNQIDGSADAQANQVDVAESDDDDPFGLD
jgi:hypothetical protein